MKKWAPIGAGVLLVAIVGIVWGMAAGDRSGGSTPAGSVSVTASALVRVSISPADDARVTPVYTGPSNSSPAVASLESTDGTATP